MSAATWEVCKARLQSELARFESLGVAFSGGVDSSVLAHAAHQVLGLRAVALIADSPSLARRELQAARATATAIGIQLVELPTSELEAEGYVANAGERCYHCKAALFGAMGAWAQRSGVRDLAFGEITDDLREERPGRRAAREARVHAPLVSAGFDKHDVRRWAREYGLPVAEKPASACLASRLPLNTPVTPERLARIEAAEDGLRDLGLRALRVRDHGRRARVEVGPDELPFARERAPEIEAQLYAAGFSDWELAAYVPPAQR